MSAVKKIFICTYEDKPLFSSDMYVPLQVGAAVTGTDLCYLKDNMGDSISDRNEYYSDISGLYWVWKHVKNVDWVGMFQYRKMIEFGNPDLRHPLPDKISMSDYVEKYSNIDDTVLEGCDVILSLPMKFSRGESPKWQYDHCHIPDDLRILEAVIKERCPEYFASYSNVMCRNQFLFPYNIFLMKTEWFMKYCEWLFDILFEVEKRLNKKIHIGYQKRALGYIAERLLNVFVSHNKLKIRMKRAAFINEYFTDKKQKEYDESVAVYESKFGKRENDNSHDVQGNPTRQYWLKI